MNKKLDKSLLPQPQKPVGWKRGLLQISTESKTDLKNQRSVTQNLPATTKFSSNTKAPFSNQLGKEPLKYQTGSEKNELNRQSRQQLSNNNTKKLMGITESQYSLEQKELLTFAANQSNEDENEANERENQNIDRQQSSLSRQNRFKETSLPQQQQQSSPQSSANKITRSSSKNKQHKSIIYTHNLPQQEQFISYSVITKQSKSGMFSNQKILLINSFKRQLMYFSKLPKELPFGSYNQMERKYLFEEKPKEVVELDKVRRFMFVPAKGSLATVTVSYVNEQGERKEWKLGMGNNSVMNDWIQLVNEVFKKQHYSVVKSQVKYPPKPKKQPQNKPNNYQTKFTRTLKQQVLPSIKQSSIRTSKANQTQLNQSQLSTSGIKSTKNAADLSKSQQKQYLIDKSKFMNTKSYIIDLEDVSNEDIFYEPEPIKVEEKQQKTPLKIDENHVDQNEISQNSLKSREYFHGIYNEEPDPTSRFSRHLQQKQKDINNEHKQRISTFMKQPSQQKPSPINEPQPIILTKKTSNERLSQTTHKDLNIHIDSRVVFEEMERDREVGSDGRNHISTSQIYETYNNNSEEIMVPVTSVDYERKIGFPEGQIYSEHEQSRTRTQTESVPIRKQQPKHTKKQAQQLHFTPNSDSLHSSSQSSTFQKPPTKPKPHLQQPPPNTRKRSNNSSFIQNNQQIQDVIVGGKLFDGYILNFSADSLSNNWLRLWLETEPGRRVEVYGAFVKACRSLVGKIVDGLQNFLGSCTMEQNNTHITFCAQNITFKVPLKMPLPQGLGQFISVIDFIRSQDFIAQTFRYDTELHHEYYNYQFLLSQLKNQFHSGTISLPIYFPMCCLVEYKGLSVLCKASLEMARVSWSKVGKDEYWRFQSEIEYVEDVARVRFGVDLDDQRYPFDLYSIYLPSFSKSIIYMDNLSQCLPLLPNPLQKNPTPSLQLNSVYIEQHIKKGLISSRRDIDEIEKHLVGNVIKRYGEHFEKNVEKIVNEKELGQILYSKGGLSKEYLGMLYRRVQDCEQKRSGRVGQASSLILTEIVLNQYLKATKLYFMKEYFKQLYSLISPTQKKPPLSQTMTQSYPQTVFQILHYLLYRNSKVWNVICVALDEKYGIAEFRKINNQRQVVDCLMGKICVEYLVLGLLGRMGVECEVRAWGKGMTWGTLPLNQNNLVLRPVPLTICYPLSLFNLQYAHLIKDIQTITQQIDPSRLLIQKNIYPSILQIFNLSQESINNQTSIITSSSYQLLEYGYKNQRLLVNFVLSHFIPAYNLSADGKKRQDQTIEIYEMLLNQESVRSSRDVSIKAFEICFNGIKWLIKQREFQLAEVLIDEQLQAINIWYTQSLLETKCKFLDLAAMFYHKKLGNRSNLAIQYALQSLQLVISNKSILPLSVCAQKCFQAAKIHYESSLLQKALQLYQLAEQYIFDSQKNKSLSQTDLSIEFLNIYLCKAQINLTMGKMNEALYESLECLRKAEEFEELFLESGDGGESEREELLSIEMNVFEVMFRCYEVGKNLKDMQRITQLGCSKFVEDKVLFFRMNTKIRNKRAQSSINPLILSKLLKMCWISLIGKISSLKQTQSFQQYQQTFSKTFTPPSRKSFCLSLSQSQKGNQLSINNLQQLQQKLQALTKLYPKSRYDPETLVMFVCQEVEETRGRMEKNLTRKEYQLIGNKKKRVSGRVERLIGERKEDDGDIGSVLYERLSEVVGELAGSKADQNFIKGHHGNYSKNRIERFNTESHPYEQQRNRYSRESRQRSIQHRPPLPYTTSKKPFTKFYHSNHITTSQFNPFSLTDQNQPELRMSYILGSSQRQQYQIEKINSYNMYSLKDEMDRKYMLIEAIFGLCGRQFVMGCIREKIDRVTVKQGSIKKSVFYE